MRRYEINETLVEMEDGQECSKQFVATLTPEEWEEYRDSFNMGIDIDPATVEALDMQAEVNYDSITGVISIPEKDSFASSMKQFAFALDETGIVFIDTDGSAENIISSVLKDKRIKNPSLPRFLYDFLRTLIDSEPKLMYSIEAQLDAIEANLYADTYDQSLVDTVNEARSHLRDLDDYYEHLQDFVEVLAENENGFFENDDTRWFRILYNRIEKIRDKNTTLREQAIQLLDLYKMNLDIYQNRIMTIFTVITVIFAPLTLLAGWYGMNFEFMPELKYPYAYPILICVVAAIVISLVIFFRKKRLL